MSRLIFAEKAWDDYIYWQETNKKMLRRINSLLSDIARNGNDGIGKPEHLKYINGWSRRIDDVHRLVYRLNGESIEIL